MTITVVTKDRVRECMSHAVEPIAMDVLHAIERDQRDSFVLAEEPADRLRTTLESKYGVASTRGRTIFGGRELLLALADLGTTPVVGVFVVEGNRDYKLYLRSPELDYLGAVVMTLD